eukprot:EG_transcript_8193
MPPPTGAADAAVWLYAAGEAAWAAFDTADQAVLEAAHRARRPLLVALSGGRQEVNLDERLLYCRYWNRPPQRVLRSLWCVGGLPYEEHHSDLLEKWYTTGAAASVDLADLRVQVVRHDTDTFVEVGPGHAERPVSRGGVFKPAVSSPCCNAPVGHLVFTVHGIGETLWSKHRFRQMGLVDYTDVLREEVHRQTEAAVAGAGQGRRMEFLPVEWFHLLHDENAALTDQLQAITLGSISLLRTFSNDAVADVLFYTSPTYQRRILLGVAEQLNRTYRLFLGYHHGTPADIPVSLIGHSLGSVILYDLLTCQRDPHLDPKLRLQFTPRCCFLLGSPLGLFLTIRGPPQDAEAELLPHNVKLFNVVHLTDPVAYRLEPLLLQDAVHLHPKHVPHHAHGGVRAHVLMKNAMAELFRVPQELFGTAGQGLRGAFQAATGAFDIVTSRKPASAKHPRHQEIEDAFVKQFDHRIDWVLQELTVSAAITNEYWSALANHCFYFQHPDVAGFVMNMTGFLDFQHQAGLQTDPPEDAAAGVAASTTHVVAVAAAATATAGRGPSPMATD